MRSRQMTTWALLVLVLAGGLLPGLAASARTLPAANAAPDGWLSFDGPRGGPAQAIAFTPDLGADRTVFAGGGRDYGRASWAGRGIFRSANSGLDWAYAGSLPNGAVFDLAISPNWLSDHLALAGLWQGVWMTTDSGVTWQQLTGFNPSGGPGLVSAVAISPNYALDRTFLAGGAYGGVYRSTDAGAIWSRMGDISAVRRVAFQPTNASIALAAAANGLWRSTDRGASWAQIIPDRQIYDIAFLGGSNMAFATWEDRVWQSTDAGATWATLGDLNVSRLDPLAATPNGAALFAAAGAQLYRYDFAAAAWTALPASLAGQYVFRLAVSPNYAVDQMVLAGTLDGVWRSENAGMGFTLSHGFYPLAVRDIEYDHTLGQMFTATELGIWRYSGFWQPVNAGIMGVAYNSIVDVAISPAFVSDDTLFAAWVSGVSIGGSIYRSTDAGLTWDRRAGAAYVSKVLLSPAFLSDRRAYALADDRILASTDGGDTWTLQPYWTSPRSARLLAISPNFPLDQRLVAVGDSVHFSTDAGTTWQTAATPPPLTEGTTIRWFANRLTAAGATTYYLGIYRFEDAEPFYRHDQLWRSTDGGNTWAVMAAAPDAPILSLAAGPDFASTPNLYLGSYDDNTLNDRDLAPDIFFSQNGGASWRNLGALPNASFPYSLLAPPGYWPETLFVGGEGMWQTDPDAAPTATPSPCQEVLRNRSFEYDGDWRLPATAYPAQRTNTKYYHGWWSMRTGIISATENRASYSDFSQDIDLPAGKTITLDLWRWPQAAAAGELEAQALPDLAPVLAAQTLEEFQGVLSTLAGDLQYGMVIAPPGGKIKFLYARLDNDRAWVAQGFDLSAYAGQRVRLQFGTSNDGSGAVAAQYFDALSLKACGATSPTHTPTPTATRPPTLTRTATPTFTPTPTLSTTPVLAPRVRLPLILRSFWRGQATPTPTPKPLPFTFGEVYPQYAIAQPTSPESLYVLDSLGRVLRSTDRGSTWQNLNVYAQLKTPGATLGGGYTPPYELWLGVAGGLFFSNDAGAHWNLATRLEPQMGVAVDFDNPNILWASGKIDSFTGVIRSTDHGSTWQRADLGINDRQLGAPILIDPQYHDMLYAITWGIRGVIGMSRGQTPGMWSSITPPITGNPFPAPALLGLAWRGDASTLWAGGVNGALMRSPNPREMSGAPVRWEEVSRFGYGYYVQPLAWGAESTLYATLHRFEPHRGAFLRSTDGGMTWRQLTLPAP